MPFVVMVHEYSPGGYLASAAFMQEHYATDTLPKGRHDAVDASWRQMNMTIWGIMLSLMG